MKRFSFLLLAAIPAFAAAASAPVSLSFTRPTTYVDGSAMPSSAISGYNVNCEFTAPGATSPTPCTMSTATIPGGTATTGALTLTYPATGGTACFTLQTVAGGIASAASSPAACKTLPAIGPSPPTNVVVTVTVALNISSASPITVTAANPVVTQK